MYLLRLATQLWTCAVYCRKHKALLWRNAGVTARREGYPHMHVHHLSGRPLGTRVGVCISCGSRPNGGRAPCTVGNTTSVYVLTLAIQGLWNAMRTSICTSGAVDR